MNTLYPTCLIIYVASLATSYTKPSAEEKAIMQANRDKKNVPVELPKGRTLESFVYNHPSPPPLQGSTDGLPKIKKLSPPKATVPAIFSINSTQQWKEHTFSQQNILISENLSISNSSYGQFQSKVIKFDNPKKLTSLSVKQTTDWLNWTESPNIGADAKDAPVLLPIADNKYYFFGKIKKAYHAFYSEDMKTWEDLGSLGVEWLTTAEYVDGHFYIYYDHPNDQDPHLIIDDNLHDLKPPTKMGVAFRDPSDGSDCAVLYDDSDQQFHIIYEDWSPIKAQAFAWDSPLAGHTASPDGFTGFEPHEYPFPVDFRTTPTGKLGRYYHSSSKAKPHQFENTKNYDPENPKTGALYYEIHEPIQEAFGDWTAIKIGSEYYLFGDHDKTTGHMGVARFHSSDWKTEPFTHLETIGDGHPDPSIAFAEGQFYLLTQQATDYTSPGPWVPGITVKIKADTTGDGELNTVIDWQTVQENYRLKPNYSRVVEVTPASVDLSNLPKIHALQFEIKIDGKASAKTQAKIKSILIH